VNIYKCFW